MHVYAKTYALNTQTFKTSLYRSSHVIGVEAYRATLKCNANAPWILFKTDENNFTMHMVNLFVHIDVSNIPSL